MGVKIEMTADEFEALSDEMARIGSENAELRLQVDWLLRERMDPGSLEQEARKPMRAKVPMTVEPPDGDE